MDVSIVIPVFNKAHLTRVCLQSLQKTLPQDLRTEVIVVDNASSDSTSRMLEDFPWVHVIRNERNLGFASANNQGARLAQGRLLLLLNNDTEVRGNWLAEMVALMDDDVGAVGARLLFANNTIQHAGVCIGTQRFGPMGFVPYHYIWGSRPELTGTQPREFQVTTGACLLTPREMYLRMGGLDEAFWNGYEDVDYCYRVQRSGKRVVVAPQTDIVHYESQSGTARFSHLLQNTDILASRWDGFPRIDHNLHYLRLGEIRRFRRMKNAIAVASMVAPSLRIVVHGAAMPAAELRALRDAILREAKNIDTIFWCVEAQPPELRGITVVRNKNSIEVVQNAMQLRGNRYLLFLNAQTVLRPGWYAELVEQAEWNVDVVAATGRCPDEGFVHDRRAFRADAACTLLRLAPIPYSINFPDARTLDEGLAQLLDLMLDFELVTRVARTPVAQLPPTTVMSGDDGIEWLEQRLRARRKGPAPDVLASIVMLSWNALDFTKLAVESIREHTTMNYEIIIVDNGSSAEVTEWLGAQSDLRVIYNKTNRGFAGGNNQGIAAARGEYIVLLNNDVIVTDHWLEDLVEALCRDAGTGVSAPRSNNIAGDQIVTDTSYDGVDAMQHFARRRRSLFRRSGYFTDRAIGFCLCIKREVIDVVGGLDETFGAGNFEDDDFCMRVRAAGFRIYVCDDVFIHHFGNVTFKANAVDWHSTMQTNWQKFAAKWELPPAYPQNGYISEPLVNRGFEHRRHHFPIRSVQTPRPPAKRDEDLKDRMTLLAVVQSEADWSVIGKLMRAYVSVFDAADGVQFALACTGALEAAILGERVEKMVSKSGRDPNEVPDVLLSDEEDLQAWAASFGDERVFEVPVRTRHFPNLAELTERSPSGLRRFYRELMGAAPA